MLEVLGISLLILVWMTAVAAVIGRLHEWGAHLGRSLRINLALVSGGLSRSRTQGRSIRRRSMRSWRMLRFHLRERRARDDEEIGAAGRWSGAAGARTEEGRAFEQGTRTDGVTPWWEEGGA